VALTARYLVDTSAAARMNHPIVEQQLGPIIKSGVVATTAALDYEAFYSTRSSSEFAHAKARRELAYEYLPTHEEHWQRALEAQFRLAASGRHRTVGIADLLTATIAEEHRLTVIHYDSDFGFAAEVLDFEHRWVAQPGSL
jgi:predicted nucleic acid-binding protein